ncbi:GNAT family N-acetyltransferase [Flexivirga alba]|uniref:GNAT family N-acetyltransferase n=1 Tax=Flexivirga alba TaxID=702742 RepID=A0ABW2AGR4_9MICO
MTATPNDLQWPTHAPVYGAIRLRQFEDGDIPMIEELATDPYVPTIGSLPANATTAEAQSYIDRQRCRLAEGAGFAFCVADRQTDVALGNAGLWVRELPHGRAGVGYSVAPSARGRGVAADALRALAGFAWTIDGLHRLEARIEPWNTASVRTAETAGFEREGLLRAHEEIGGRRVDLLMYSLLRPDNRSVTDN